MQRTHKVKQDSAPGSALTVRALLIGVALVVANAYWMNEASWGGRILHGYISLFVNTVFTLFLLVVGNEGLRRVAPRQALRNSEIFVIFIMVQMVSTLAGNTNMGYLIYLLAYPIWFATPENDWGRLFVEHIPSWMAPRDMPSLGAFLEGESSFFTRQHIGAWLVPMVTWTAFILVLYFVLICMNSILRKQFSDTERLTYPITKLPVEMGLDPGKFFTNRFMWLGFGVAGMIEMINAIGVHVPAIPPIPVWFHNITPYFNEKPWDAVGTMLISVWPSVIGLSFLMPLDMAFSSWFFFLFGKVLLVGRAALGLRLNLYLDEQSEGAWIGLGILALWVGRRHLQTVFRQALSRAGRDEDDEILTHRWALWGIVGGVGLILLMCLRAGAAPLWATVFFAIYFLMAISLTKVRAGLGPPMHEVISKDPGRTMVSGLGSHMIGPRSLTILTFFFWMNRVNTAHPMPNQLEAIHIGRQAGIRGRQIFLAMMIGLAVAVPVVFITYGDLSYRIGGNQAGHTLGPMKWPWVTLGTWITMPTELNVPAILAMGTGFATTMGLTALKMRFVWWPFHPIGYVIGTGVWGDMSFYWFPVLLSWATKLVILRTGGFTAYRKALPFFVGLILGDYIIGSIWSLIGVILGIHTYAILIGR